MTTEAEIVVRTLVEVGAIQCLIGFCWGWFAGRNASPVSSGAIVALLSSGGLLLLSAALIGLGASL